jgi:hypothetical protein
MDIQVIVIERGQRPHDPNHGCHWMRIAAETPEEILYLIMQHGMARNHVLKICQLLLGGQGFIQQQIANFQKAAVLRQLLYRITTVEQRACIPIQIRNFTGTTSGRHETGVVSEITQFLVQFTDVNGFDPDARLKYIQLDLFASGVISNGDSLFGHAGTPKN